MVRTALLRSIICCSSFAEARGDIRHGILHLLERGGHLVDLGADAGYRAHDLFTLLAHLFLDAALQPSDGVVGFIRCIDGLLHLSR